MEALEPIEQPVLMMVTFMWRIQISALPRLLIVEEVVEQDLTTVAE